jgi:spore coat protein U-like protein
MNRRLALLLASSAAALAALFVAVAPARALTSTGTVTVKATVAALCVLNSPTLTFGAYDPTTVGPIDLSTTLTVNCTKGTAWVIGLDQGLNGGVGVRNMKDTGTSGDVLHYELYTDVAGGTAWTNGATASASVKSGTGTGAAAGQNVTVFGRLFAGQFVTASSYQDSVKATVNF